MHKQICRIVIVAITTIIMFLSDIPIQSLVEAAGGFSIDLIHRDSPQSPSYNHSLSASEILRKAAHRSNARLHYFKSLSAANYTKTSGFQSTTQYAYPGGGEYLMKLYVGSPPVQFFAIADTGSDLIWVQCTSSNDHCFKPSRSSTYQQFSCHSRACHDLPLSACAKANTCLYVYSYVDESNTTGFLSADTISLDSTGGQVVPFPALAFGFSYDSKGDFDFSQGSSGLVGLGGGPLSLVSQLGTEINYKFSYCLVPYTSNYSSALRFGQDAVISNISGSVVTTPLLSDPKNPTYYLMTLESISIGQATTQSPQSPANIIIDSGSTLVTLEKTLYTEVDALVRLVVAAQSVEDPNGAYSLCYDGGVAVNFPDMVFHFTGADLLLPSDNMFVPNDNLTCMVIVPGDQGSLSIFGNLAQINFQVEYDLLASQISFAPANCILS